MKSTSQPGVLGSSQPEYVANLGRGVDFPVSRDCHAADLVAACLSEISTLNRLFSVGVTQVAWGRLSFSHTNGSRS